MTYLINFFWKQTPVDVVLKTFLKIFSIVSIRFAISTLEALTSAYRVTRLDLCPVQETDGSEVGVSHIAGGALLVLLFDITMPV